MGSLHQDADWDCYPDVCDQGQGHCYYKKKFSFLLITLVCFGLLTPNLVHATNATKITTSFLAHLSTKCSVSFCDPSMSVVGVCVRACVRATVNNFLNNISSETAYWILTKLHRNDPWVVPYHVVQTVPVGCISRSRGQ